MNFVNALLEFVITFFLDLFSGAILERLLELINVGG
jgi:hypothetical protein